MEVEIRRGDVVWVSFPPIPYPSHVQWGIRPAVVIQNDGMNQRSQTAIVVPVTSSIKRLDLSTHVVFDVDFLPEQSMAVCEQFLTIDRERIPSNAGHLPRAIIQQIDLGIIRSVFS